MKTAAVAYINFMENSLEQKVVSVPKSASWQDAYVTAFVIGTDLESDDEYRNWLYNLSSNLDEANQHLCNNEMAVSVAFIPMNEGSNVG